MGDPSTAAARLALLGRMPPTSIVVIVMPRRRRPRAVWRAPPFAIGLSRATAERAAAPRRRVRPRLCAWSAGRAASVAHVHYPRAPDASSTRSLRGPAAAALPRATDTAQAPCGRAPKCPVCVLARIAWHLHASRMHDLPSPLPSNAARAVGRQPRKRKMFVVSTKLFMGGAADFARSR